MAPSEKETDALVVAMLSMAANLPQAAAELRDGRMSVGRQRLLGSLSVPRRAAAQARGRVLRTDRGRPAWPALDTTAVTRLALLGLVVVGPPLLCGLLLLAHDWSRRRRTRRPWRNHRRAVSVAESTGRIARERAPQQPIDRRAHHEPGLPAGWRWPHHDPDGLTRDHVGPKPCVHHRTGTHTKE